MNGITKFALSVLFISTVLVSVKYEQEDILINEKNENIYVIDVDMNSDLVEIKNKLSFDKLYGFQTMSEMASDADYAINGMFYDTLGMPYGSIVEDGQLVQWMEMDAPKLVIDKENNVYIDEIEFSVQAKIAGKSIEIVTVNGALYDNKWGVFNSYNGTSTRVHGWATSYIIKNEIISDIVYDELPVDISTGEQVLVKRGKDDSFKKGDKCDILFKNSLDIADVKTVFTLGAWLVKNGENIAEDYNPFIGPTITNQPRTIVGITKNKHLIFIVIDGRSKKSLGINGKECAELLLDYGAVRGGYLDGGASSEMLVNGKVVNEVSGKKERKIAHAIAIYENKYKE